MANSNKSLTRYQTFSFDADGVLVHAGVHSLRRFGHREAWKLQRSWERWRNWYNRTQHSDKLARRSIFVMPACLTFYGHPIDNPEQIKHYCVSESVMS